MNRVHQIKQCFPLELANRIHKLLKDTEWKYGWRSNPSMGYGHWNKDFGRGGPENGIDITGNLPLILKEAWDYLETVYVPNSILTRCYTNAHTFGIEGYPHVDSERNQDRTIVIYMNQDWRREWGGETIVYEGNEIHYAELPKFNKGLIFYGNQFHCAKSVSRICPDLRMTLMFKFAPINSDPQRDQLQRFLTKVGANKIPHSGRQLMGHLLNTYDILKTKGCSDAVCRAGAMHSIFGTNIFKTKTLDIDSNKITIENLVGIEAAELVELFARINRPYTLEKMKTTLDLTTGGTVEVSQKILEQLCQIEAANLRDQAALAQWPELSAYWNKLKLD